MRYTQTVLRSRSLDNSVTVRVRGHFTEPSADDPLSNSIVEAGGGRKKSALFGEQEWLPRNGDNNQLKLLHPSPPFLVTG